MVFNKILMKLKRSLQKPLKKLRQNSDSKKNKNKDFSIISNNCWGGFVYQHLKLDYKTPFIGLFLLPDDYIKLLNNLEYYLGCNLKFTDNPKHVAKVDGKEYPVGILDDVEIYFMHYKSKEEALEKWNRRVKRLNFNNLFIVFAETKLCSKTNIDEFNKVKYKNKICFTAKKYNYNNFIYLKSYNKQGYLSPDYMEKYHKYFDVVQWLNNCNN
ncbi:MAG: DUF1919 domain-containing protein [Clostridium sp.]|nr:DUF1919 domain-containing protein [Clostridium sp.]